MANYPFEELLSPIDFEHLVRDLISRDLRFEFTAFAEGKDQGVDLRYSHLSNEIIVQCKRTKSISKQQLVDEFDKVSQLNKQPEQYYLATACDLSVAKFAQIRTIFKAWMVGDENIYTKIRLNSLLDAHPDIQQKHYKLWLNSAAIFNQLISTPLYERAKALISDIKKDFKYYVKNDSLNKSLDILNTN